MIISTHLRASLFIALLCSTLASDFDPVVVVAPFVAVVREAYLAGPYKLIALDTIQTLLSCCIFDGCKNACDALSEVVDAVTRFSSTVIMYESSPPALMYRSCCITVGANLYKLIQPATIWSPFVWSKYSMKL